MNTTQFTAETDSRIIETEGTAIICRTERDAYDLSREALAWGVQGLTFTAVGSVRATRRSPLITVGTRVRGTDAPWLDKLGKIYRVEQILGSPGDDGDGCMWRVSVRWDDGQIATNPRIGLAGRT